MKIAIIDDSVDDRQILTSYLHTFFAEVYANIPLFIQDFSSGEEFLSAFTSASFDIIFIDYYMKELSGLETASQIRKEDPTVSLLFTTASKDYALDGYLVKASGYLLKPITYEKFAETLRLLDLKRMKGSQCIEFNNGNEKKGFY